MVFEGDAMLVRTAVGLLARLEGRLYGTREEILEALGTGDGTNGTWDLGGEEVFMGCVREMGKVDGEEVEGKKSG